MNNYCNRKCWQSTTCHGRYSCLEFIINVLQTGNEGHASRCAMTVQSSTWSCCTHKCIDLTLNKHRWCRWKAEKREAKELLKLVESCSVVETQHLYTSYLVGLRFMLELWSTPSLQSQLQGYLDSRGCTLSTSTNNLWLIKQEWRQ